MELLSAGDFEQFVRREIILFKNQPGFPISIALVYTTMFERSMHRYRESRSYRVLHFDLGHLSQTVALVATALNRPHRHGYATHEKAVEHRFGLSGIKEACMGYTLLG